MVSRNRYILSSRLIYGKIKKYIEKVFTATNKNDDIIKKI